MKEQEKNQSIKPGEVNEPPAIYLTNTHKMLTLAEIKQSINLLKSKLADDFAVERIGIFGSFARNEQTENSDIDILVEFSRPVGYEFFRLQRFLEKQLGRKIDLATKAMLKSRIKDSILEETTFV